MTPTFYFRWRWLILVGFLAAMPWVLYGANRAWQHKANRVEDWLPEAFDETHDLLWFVERFGSDELVMISWPGCTLDDERLWSFREKLLEPAPHQDGEVIWFWHAFIGPEVVQTLTDPPLEVPRPEVMRRLEGWLVGKDHWTTCAIALVSEAGIQDRHMAIEHVFQSAESIGLSRDELRLAGPTYDSVAIDNASKNSLLQFNLWSFAICITLMLLCFRSVRLAIMVFVVAWASEMASLALIHYSGGHLDSVLLLVANLTFVLCISAGVHLVNYYREVSCKLEGSEAVAQAVRMACRPTLLATGTTALGMAALMASQITPIYNFGGYAAASVVLATILVLTLVPTGMVLWPQRRRQPKTVESLPSSATADFWQYPSMLLYRYSGVVLAPVVPVLVVALIGIARIDTSVSLHDMFSEDSKVIEDYQWLEEHIGYLVPVEIVLRFPRDEDDRAADRPVSRFADRMRLVERVGQAAVSIDGVGAAISAASFGPVLPPPHGGIRSAIRRTVAETQVYAQREQFRQLGFLQEDEHEQLWRVSVRVAASERLDYGDFLSILPTRIRPILNQDVEAAQDVNVVFTGGVPLIHKVQGQLLEDLLRSFALAFLLIAITLVVLLRSVSAGLLTMIPNVLPSAVVFGVMGWLDINIEIGSILTASAALGIAVDDTMHFILWFRRGLAEGQTQREAVTFAYRRCGLAMIHTSLICRLGLLVFAASDFVPIAQFAWLMFMLLMLALLCDLVVMPAVLLTRLGRLYMQRPPATLKSESGKQWGMCLTPQDR